MTITNSLTDAQVNSLVKIQGTVFDRHRKITESEVEKMRKMKDNGCKLIDIAKEFNIRPGTITYRLMSDEERKIFNIERNLRNPQIGRKISKESVDERIAYKRALLAVKESHS